MALRPLIRARRRLSKIRSQLGDPRRRRAILLLACVLGLDSADLATLGAVAPQLEHALHIDDLQVGVLASVVSLMAALATLPIGWLSDRLPRVPLLAASLAVWSAAMIATGASRSFLMLLVSRLFLGAVQATSGPTLASLTGDYFRVRERSRIFGWIHTGELLGGGFGLVASGELAALLSWRYAFWALAIPGIVLALALWRLLPEPRRGGQSRFGHPERDRQPEEMLATLIREQGVEPDPQRVLDADARRISVRAAARYLLQIRSFVLVTAAFSLGYFFLGGARTFGVIFFRGHFHLGQAAGTAISGSLGLGALGGVIAGGRVADRLLAGGRIDARLLVSAVGYLAAAAIFIPAIGVSVIYVSLPVFILGAAALTLPSGPLDAGLLDLIPAPLWGRGEGIQTATRTVAMALAPILFGYMADALSAHGGHAFGQGTYGSHPTGGPQGLQVTFLIMLLALGAAGLLLVMARHKYPRDAATASVSEQRVGETTAALSAGAADDGAGFL